MCEGMQWSHLPVQGGIYDQDPLLIDAFELIWSRKGQIERNEAKKPNSQQRQAAAGRRTRGPAKP